VHVGSFSKSLAPGVRLGYVVAGGELHERMVALKQETDVCSPSLMQRTVARYLERGVAHRHWKSAGRLYRTRLATMERALRRHLPEGTAWAGVEGGLFLWVRLPDGVRIWELYEGALARG